MAALRFIGTYPKGWTSITLCGVTFNGREPTETDEPRLLRHPEFEAVEQDEAPKKRGRPRKVEAE